MVDTAATKAIRRFSLASGGSALPISVAAAPNGVSPTDLPTPPGADTEAIPIAHAGGPRLSSMRFFPQSPRSRAAGTVRAVAGIAERTLSFARHDNTP